MKTFYVDTNVVLRFITGSPPDQAAQVKKLFEAADKGEAALILDEIVLAETVWVLSSFYQFDKQVIKEVLQVLIAHQGIVMEDEASALLALSLYADLNVDFEDALLSVHMDQAGVREIVTFDRHFQRLPGVVPLLPGAL